MLRPDFVSVDFCRERQSSIDGWIVGFLTDEDLRNFNLGAEFVSVYVPQAYNFAGQLYMGDRKRVRLIEQVPSGEAMKYAVTGGVVEVDKAKIRNSK